MIRSGDPDAIAEVMTHNGHQGVVIEGLKILTGLSRVSPDSMFHSLTFITLIALMIIIVGNVGKLARQYGFFNLCTKTATDELTTQINAAAPNPDILLYSCWIIKNLCKHDYKGILLSLY